MSAWCFQAYALFPNMTVADNVAFGLKVAKRPEAEIKARVAEMLEMIKLPHLADRYPYQCSGGQQQRVALARALAHKPKVLLLDEPLSALDAKIRVSLREEIRALQRELGITTVFVTHDQEEALSMSDRIVVMNEGRVDQVGTPFEIYNNPATKFVASFVGTLSILKGKVLDANARRIQIGEHEIIAGRGAINARAGEDCTVALRPEAAKLANGHALNGHNKIGGTIEDVHFLGSVVRIKVRVQDNAIALDTFNDPSVCPAGAGRAGDGQLHACRRAGARRRLSRARLGRSASNAEPASVMSLPQSARLDSRGRSGNGHHAQHHPSHRSQSRRRRDRGALDRARRVRDVGRT